MPTALQYLTTSLNPNIMNIVEWLVVLNLIVTLLVILLVLSRTKAAASGTLQSDLSLFGAELNKIGPLLRDELTRGREEGQRMSRETREELSNSVKLFADNLAQHFQTLLSQQGRQSAEFSERLTALVKMNEDKFEKLIVTNATNFTEFRDQMMASLKSHREEATQAARDGRGELTVALKSFETQFSQNVKEFNELQRQKFFDLIGKQEQVKIETENKLEQIRGTVENKLGTLQEENNKKLDEMRNTVDEKLQSSVEKRFNESFKLISERLDQVHKGLGEMQTLATGVGDLKKVLTNVKTRGNLGEVQLGAILEEIFSRDQYEQNVVVRPASQERVEFAIKLPGKNADNQPLLLPIDSKFPNEDYQRLIEAYENISNLDGKTVEGIGKQFENAVRKCAKDICDKYINPPSTTDFAILFVPTEGLYAEILRRVGLFDGIRRDHRVTIVGPSTLVAFLNSLQMGFRTLAIEKRSSEVWSILGAVKSEFSLFGTVLANTKKKLEQVTKTIDSAGIRTRAIERHLRKVEELPQEQAVDLIGKALEMEAEDLKDEEKETTEE
jgi:DNA recombination protein RmuC